MKFDLLVFIGRFQPPHHGHLAVIGAALEAARHVLVLAGSANRPRSERDPFTADERIAMLKACFGREALGRLTIVPLDDVPADDAAWVASVRRAALRCLAAKLGPAMDGATAAGTPTAVDAWPRIGLAGHAKDGTSYYLRLFPEWGVFDVPNHRGLDATALRELYFAANVRDGVLDPRLLTALGQRVPAAVLEHLAAFAATPHYASLEALARSRPDPDSPPPEIRPARLTFDHQEKRP